MDQEGNFTRAGNFTGNFTGFANEENPAGALAH